ncbi:DNA polymerase III gamma and tau subunits DnaX2 (plasmid) [Butyrivibrio proteoclasticus B316]|uniref:DNA-directed DNA polymerase n=1 Tax=Butyrivibrio proteoclasticus (strain ATCC 51982 / DSM 14932 / B316) TaxID=515622 RepID=E0S513_BUTPB|nr:DNA polymerase III subunit gamma/tau [Butyrivibrio proteoclasticus]ADL36495.1 DNA polymerase III gamma and tau subunits DnaX2 [Butyrivibrio proteoclasticus B316]
MGYLALYRKFRPQSFDEVQGQDYIVTALRNQVKHDMVSHAYLFHGTRGTGKTTLARIFARAINCENTINGNPCGECDFCKSYASGSDANIIEIDAASNSKVVDVRRIIAEVSYPPMKGKWKVYIIDEVHMLYGKRGEAFDILLKTLEEPPPYAVFILATTEMNKVPATILSRCQQYAFRRISIDIIEQHLRMVTEAERIPAEETALQYIAKVADGSMRDALSILEHVIFVANGKELSYDIALESLRIDDTKTLRRMFFALYEKDLHSAIVVLSEKVAQGVDLYQLTNEIIWYLRNLMLLQKSDQIDNLIEASSENLQIMKDDARKVDSDTIMLFLQLFSELSSDIRYTEQKRVMIEALFVKLCKRSRADNEYGKRLSILEEHSRYIENMLHITNNGTYTMT